MFFAKLNRFYIHISSWNELFAEPVPGKRREPKNVLSKMQRTIGPLGMLHGCMENRIRIRVGHVD